MMELFFIILIVSILYIFGNKIINAIAEILESISDFISGIFLGLGFEAVILILIIIIALLKN
jgi:hypothetical protein